MYYFRKKEELSQKVVANKEAVEKEEKQKRDAALKVQQEKEKEAKIRAVHKQKEEKLMMLKKKHLGSVKYAEKKLKTEAKKESSLASVGAYFLSKNFISRRVIRWNEGAKINK